MAQVGLPDLSTSPALVQTTSDDGTYRYRLLATGAILVDKRTPEGGWEQTYLVSFGTCSCPGFGYRADCKHADVARGLQQWWREHQPAPQ